MSRHRNRKPPPGTLDLLVEANRLLASAGIRDSQLEAELLLASALGTSRGDLYVPPGKDPTQAEAERFLDFVVQRMARAPIQYITGEAAFRHLAVLVGDAVLIPRPETEILVETALEFLGARNASTLLEPGCGSGAVAVSLAFECASAQIVATDIDQSAIRIARENAKRYGVRQRIGFLCGDLFAPVGRAARFDAIVCNPPYVQSCELASLDPEIRDYEPHLALDGGPDGLVFFRRIAAEAASLLEPGGRLLLEVGDGQSATVVELLQRSGRYTAIEVRDDLNGIARVVSGRRD